MSADTQAAYYAMALARPVRAVRYLNSIRESLANPDLHEIEARRLHKAELGILDGLRFAGACRECGRALETLESLERGVGADCAAKLARRAS